MTKIKTSITFLFSFAVLLCHSQQNMEQILDEACACLHNVELNAKTKIEFDKTFGHCVDQFSKNAKTLDTSYNNVKKFNELIQENLKTSCKHFKSIDSLYNHYSTIKNTHFIISSGQCEILKKGKFISKGDTDSTLIFMNDTIQTLKFKDGTYTKSKINWDTPCSYILTHVKSTNDYEKQMRKPGDQTAIRIIKVVKNEISFEMDINGRTYNGTLIKLE